MSIGTVMSKVNKLLFQTTLCKNETYKNKTKGAELTINSFDKIHRKRLQPDLVY